ncbi:hypothetical protein [Microbacterium hydrocarbonoxydans]|uniref:Uncharacterized protein n=1 Tax=Microbacterium hydrocarbonoxydans TaxID=273678 RepID=A0A1H4MKB8_9MICO|nr:hypothetical protein [Microbacterium hydrocarbonoxydans]SEB82812.1 hypothetical protein SAMN04489807_2157 [Microbacterium hydrocarbonoxydans]
MPDRPVAPGQPRRARSRHSDDPRRGVRVRRATADTLTRERRPRPLENRVFIRLFADLMEEDEADTFDAPAPLAARLREIEEERSRWTRVAALPGADLRRSRPS